MQLFLNTCQTRVFFLFWLRMILFHIEHFKFFLQSPVISINLTWRKIDEYLQFQIEFANLVKNFSRQGADETACDYHWNYWRLSYTKESMLSHVATGY